MTNGKIMKIEDFQNESYQNFGQFVSLEGYLVSSGIVEVVDDPASPNIKVLVENLTLDDLLKKAPERFRLGGRFIWEEKARVTGILYEINGGLKIKDVKMIDLLSVGESLTIDQKMT